MFSQNVAVCRGRKKKFLLPFLPLLFLLTLLLSLLCYSRCLSCCQAVCRVECIVNDFKNTYLMFQSGQGVVFRCFPCDGTSSVLLRVLKMHVLRCCCSPHVPPGDVCSLPAGAYAPLTYPNAISLRQIDLYIPVSLSNRNWSIMLGLICCTAVLSLSLSASFFVFRKGVRHILQFRFFFICFFFVERRIG